MQGGNFFHHRLDNKSYEGKLKRKAHVHEQKQTADKKYIKIRFLSFKIMFLFFNIVTIKV